MGQRRIIVLMGAPGSGKGTQASMLSKKYGWPQISTGDILRAIAKENTPIGEKIREIQRLGDLVSDEILAAVIRARTAEPDCDEGYILDGFPRTLPQGEMLEDLAREQGRVIVPLYVRVLRHELMNRLTGRRTCPTCNTIYNMITRPPRFDTVCDQPHATPLVHRSDDNEESVAHRLEIYTTMTKPLYEYYRGSERLTVIDGAAPVEEVFQELCKTIEA